MATTLNIEKWKIQHKLIRNMHIVVLLLCLALIVLLSIDIFRDVPKLTHQLYMKIQFWICMVFIADFFLEFFLSQNKWHYLYTHILFLLVSIPYLSIIEYSGIRFTAETEYFIRFIPLIRGGYALSIVVSWLSYSSASSLFVTYTTILFSTIYFSSLLFFNVESSVNPMVTKYSDALWWACMDVTTVGSNINALTGLGKALSVLLASLGMMMFPIFTVYITNRVIAEDKKKKAALEQLLQEGKIPEDASNEEVGEMEKKVKETDSKDKLRKDKKEEEEEDKPDEKSNKE
ncbi:MAG: ion channel [Bacteroidales bacterium]